MVYMIFDNPAEEKNMMFLKADKTAVIQQIYPLKKCSSLKEMLVVCKKIIDCSSTGDTIICWYDFMAIICWWLCKIQFKKRNIVVLNILLKDKATIKNKLAKFLYKTVLKSNNVQATVTSRMYGEYLNTLLGIHKEYILLHDVYHDDYRIDYKGKSVSNTVFCGGRNGRDWELLIKIAQEMPEVKFNCVMPKDKFEQYKEKFSDNMLVRTEIPERDFLECMCQSQLVVMPLDTQAPAGLITFYQAAANGKMSITSDTVTSREYFSDGRGALCGNDIKIWKNTIFYYLQHTEETNVCVSKIKSFLKNECSEEKYAQILAQTIME